MKIVSWNCNDGFIRKENDFLEILASKTEYPEILVIQECTKSDFDLIKTKWSYKNWYGDDIEISNRGVAIFSNEYKIEFTENFNRNFRYVVPYHISGKGNEKFILFAVWTKPVPFYYDKNVKQAVKFQQYTDLLKKKVIVIGDFNTFAKNCEDVKNLEVNIPLDNCAKECRMTHTFHFHNNSENSGIDDFCFASPYLAKDASMRVLDDEKFWELSDHCPIIVDFAF
jgi:exonuclease III